MVRPVVPSVPKRVDHDAKDGLLQPETHNDIVVLGVDDQRVAPTAVVDQLEAAVTAGLPAIALVPAQHGSKFFPRQRLLGTDLVKPRHQDAGGGRHA